jgi:hypothetical protein
VKNYRVLITEVNSDHPGWRDCGAIELINGKLIAKPIKDATRTRQGFGAVVLQKHSVHYTGIPNPWQSKVASALAWLIALVAAANSFFGWQKAWQLYTQTHSHCSLLYPNGSYEPPKRE